MNKEELKKKVRFINEDKPRKTIQVFVTTEATDLQLFNIQNEYLDGLLEMFSKEIKSAILDSEYVIEEYSTSLNRGSNVLHSYDLEGLRPEMQRMTDVVGIKNPDYFDISKTAIEKINAIYIVIKSNDNKNILTLYKTSSNVDKFYASSSFFFFPDKRMFKLQKENMLRVSPSFQMLQIDGKIILKDLAKIEKLLNLAEVLEKETKNKVKEISGNLVEKEDKLVKVCAKPSLNQKLRHALVFSPVVKGIKNGSLTMDTIIDFINNRPDLKFSFNSDKTKFAFKNNAEAISFIKLMDDDYLMSDLTKIKYDSNDKTAYSEKKKGDFCLLK